MFLTLNVKIISLVRQNVKYIFSKVSSLVKILKTLVPHIKEVPYPTSKH